MPCTLCYDQLFKCMNHLGVCQSSSTTRTNVDKLVKESGQEIQQWKSALEADSPVSCLYDMVLCIHYH